MAAEAVLTGTSAARTVAALFPPGIGVGACVVGQGGPLLGMESAAMARAVPARRAEFAAGRDAARQAMARLGLPARPIPMTEDRSPIWPAGVTGSITHHGALALAVAARAGVLGLGLDAEPDEDLPGDLLPLIFPDPAERRLLAASPQPLRRARDGFAAKEAAYKCQFARSRQLLEFTELRLDALAADAATLRLTRAAAPYAAGAVLRVRLARAEGLVIAGCADPLPGPAGAADASG